MNKLAPAVEKVTLQIELTVSEADYLRRFAYGAEEQKEEPIEYICDHCHSPNERMVVVNAVSEPAPTNTLWSRMAKMLDGLRK
jgi:hypothetical protein